MIGEVPHDEDRLVGIAGDHLMKGVQIFNDVDYVTMSIVDLDSGDLNESESEKNTLYNWQVLLGKAKEMLLGWQRDYFEEDGLTLAVTPQERAPLRGKAKGKKFGF